MGLKRYVQDAFNELMHKVTWPTWSELQSSAIVVMVASLVIAMLVFVMDFSFRNILEFVYSVIK